MESIESNIWFDYLPTEIIFLIFNYLSNNDIIYTFFFLNQRFNNLFLQNQQYFNYLKLPTKNFDIWKNIFSIIGSQIESLDITTINLSFPLAYFPNLKSILISSPYGLLYKEFQSIIENNQFQNLHQFKIKQLIKIDLNANPLLSISFHDIIKKIFNHENSLKIFQSSILISDSALNNTNYFEINHNLHSLTLKSTCFERIFSLLEYTPNLKYLNIQSGAPFANKIELHKIITKLEQFHFILEGKIKHKYDLQKLVSYIKYFSSSLTCLSLNLVDDYIQYTDEIPFNSRNLQQFLESMTQLRKFHFYAKLSRCSINSDIILSEFQNEYWFNHNLSFGMHDKYFYTLPFHFEHIHDFYKCFNAVKSNNPEILMNNPRIWYNIKAIIFSNSQMYDVDFIKELKIKMPKLSSIKFRKYEYLPRRETKMSFISNDETEGIDLQLNNVTTIELTEESTENLEDWIKYSLPNLRYLILSSVRLSSINIDMAQLLNEKIQYLIINKSRSRHQPLGDENHIYFSNVQYISLNIYSSLRLIGNELYSYIIQFLTNIKHLKALFLYIRYPKDLSVFLQIELREFIKCLDKNEIVSNYEVKYIGQYFLFIKREFNNSEVENNVSITSRNSSFFSKLKLLFSRAK